MTAHYLLLTLALPLLPQAVVTAEPADLQVIEARHVQLRPVRAGALYASSHLRLEPIQGVALTPIPAPGLVWRHGVPSPSPLPREAWLQADPADSLYKAARGAMATGSSKQAAALFEKIVEEHPESGYAGDAPYWQAFNLYRLATSDGGGGEESDPKDLLRRALAALELQRERYPDAPTRKNGEAGTLATRVTGFQGRLQPNLAGAVLADAQTRISGSVVYQAGGARLTYSVAAGSGDLEEQCEDPDLDVRSAALSAAVNASREGAVAILRQVLDRTGGPCETILRRKTPYLLAQTRTPEGQDLLLELAASDADTEVQRSAMWQISRMDDERVVPLLGGLTRSENEHIAERAISALGNRRDSESNEILWQIAESADVPVDLRGSALYQLSRRGGENLERLKALFDRAASQEVRKHLIADIARAGEGGDWLLQVARRADLTEELRSSAVFYLARSDATPVSTIAALYDELQNEEARKGVLRGLAGRDEPEALDKLIAVARGEESQELRKSAIFWLGRSEDPRALEVLLEIVNR